MDYSLIQQSTKNYSSVVYFINLTAFADCINLAKLNIRDLTGRFTFLSKEFVLDHSDGLSCGTELLRSVSESLVCVATDGTRCNIDTSASAHQHISPITDVVLSYVLFG